MKLRSFATTVTALVTVLVPLLVTVPVAAPANAAAGDPHPPAETPVSGRIDALAVRGLALCSRPCISGDRLGVDDTEGGEPEALAPPEFYDVALGSGGDFEVAAEAGRYRIAFHGRVSRDRAPVESGYLRRHPSGAYTLVSGFTRGTRFTVEEAAAVDLGRVAVRAQAAGSVDGWGTLHIISDTYAYARITARRIPRGTTITVVSYGCGKARTRQVIRRSGSFRFQWQDPHANRHYHRSLELRAVISKPGHLPRRLDLVTWSIPRSYGWRCRG